MTASSDRHAEIDGGSDGQGCHGGVALRDHSQFVRKTKHAQGLFIKGNARHPIVGDDVVIYAGATILGRITIGNEAIIGGNV